ncbi:hypothetical protein SaccyDRAFT_2276 [Saccharomonospora cyanea NA-134]|uniref:DUF6881 domain-containing protein n=2 Tax=Saccharomonospora cyanea TaxID=40989 RepID=H5XPS8_9PSEU|nr:hypothetical protein SaccyDRAFT_2276 [Saccharomonospora cyanea NA-134]
MRYVKVAWEHESPDEPVLFLSELDADGYETRKVQFYRDGRAEWADETRENEAVGLAEIPLPRSLNEILGQPEFDAQVIDPAEFECAWQQARTNH